jgi:isopentenyldiphosphate isomerase
MNEIIDIYDANLRRFGTADRLAAHLNGEWHQTFHLWIASSTAGGSLIFQLRSPSAKNYPNLLDITAAGHLQAGEDVEHGVREVTEELGIVLDFAALHPLGYRVEVADQDNGQRNREYQAVFLTRDDRPSSEFKPDPGEVYGLIYVPISTGMELFSGGRQDLSVHGIAYDKQSGAWQPVSDTLTLQRFLPRISKYYLTMLIMAERLLEGKKVLAIS